MSNQTRPGEQQKPVPTTPAQETQQRKGNPPAPQHVADPKPPMPPKK